MTTLSFVVWGIELILEVLGARRAYHRRIRPLGNFLAAMALSDMICLLILADFGTRAYFWAWYGQRLIQYVLFAQLVMYLCAKMVGADKKTTRFYLAGAAILAGVAVVFFHLQPFTMTNVLHFAAGTYFLLGLALCLGLLGQEKEAWTWMGIAALILAASNGMLSAMHAQKLPVMDYYPIGEIAALSMWLLAVWEKRETIVEQITAAEREPELQVNSWDEKWLHGLKISL